MMSTPDLTAEFTDELVTRALVRDVTDAVSRNFDVPPEGIVVQIMETEPDLKAKGGVLLSEH